MLIRACVLLLYCFIAVTACASKSEVTQQSATNTQQSSTTQPPASGAATNTQGENLNGATPSANGATDACALITKPEIQEIQGEAVKETKSTDRSNGSFAISQCFYSLPTYNKSVSLQVTRSNNAKDQSGVKEFWNHTFHKAGKEEKESEEAEKEKRGKGEEAEKERGRGEGEEEEGAPPKPVNGIGDEAFWAGGRVAGALYVLKGNAFIRISIGGSGDEAEKIEKLKALSRKALSRL